MGQFVARAFGAAWPLLQRFARWSRAEEAHLLHHELTDMLLAIPGRNVLTPEDLLPLESTGTYGRF